MRVYAPGKLILSGEHAVVYGCPALAMAVNRYVTATITPTRQARILFELADLAHRSHLSFEALRYLKNKIKQKYHRFVSGEYTIRDVLQKPFELAQFALSMVTELLGHPLKYGMNIHLQSDIPIGCGMGSSAATILCVMQAIAHYAQLTLTPEMLYQLALEAENMQHGRSSGLDLRVALQGGCLFIQGDQIETRPLPTSAMYFVNTGTPLSSTGQCVLKVAESFAAQIADEFSAVTLAMDAAIQNHSLKALNTAMRANHELLVRIGVVPQHIQHFIADIEAAGGAAKVCGAGATLGDQAGIVWISLEEQLTARQICENYGYELMPIHGELRGVHVI